MRSLLLFAAAILVFAATPATDAGDVGHAFEVSGFDGSVDGQGVASVHVDINTPVDGYQFSICHDTDLLDLVDVDSLDLGEPDFEGVTERPEDGYWFVGVIADFEGVDLLTASGDAFDATYAIINPGCSLLEFCTDGLDGGGNSVALDGEPAEVTDLTDGEVCGTSPFTFRLHSPETSYDESTEEGSATIVFAIENTETTATNAFTLSVGHDPLQLDAVSATALSPIEDLNGGTGPDFFSASLDPSGESGISVGCVFHFTDDEITMDYTDGADLVEIEYEVVTGPLCEPDGPPVIAELTLKPLAGQQNEVVIGLEPVLPNLIDDEAGLSFECCTIAELIHGDADADGDVDGPDVLYMLAYQFLAGPGVCEEAMDLDDNGIINLSDVFYHLHFIYLDGPDPAAPYPDCGPDEDDDDLHCCVTSCDT